MACTAAIHLWANSAAACSSQFVPSAIFASWTSTSQNIHIPGVRDLKATNLMQASVPEQSGLLYQFDERRYMRYTHSITWCPTPPFPFPPITPLDGHRVPYLRSRTHMWGYELRDLPPVVQSAEASCRPQ